MPATTNPSASSAVPAAELRQRNARLGLILASVAAVFFLGFIVRIALLHGA
jgi:hypothetical protein